MYLLKQSKNYNITRISLLLSIATAVIACIIIGSWIFNTLNFIKLKEDQTITKINTGVCFLLASLSLICLAKKKYKWPGIIMASSVIIFNILNLSQYLFNYSLGIDEFLIKDSFTLGNNFPGRMTVNASIYFIFTGVLSITISVGFKPKLAEMLMPPFWASTVLSLLAYLYAIAYPEDFPDRNFLSPITVIACFFFATAILFHRIDEGFLAPFTKKTEAAKLNRRMLVYGITLAVLMGWLRNSGELSGLFQHSIGFVLLAGAYILFIMYATKSATVKLNTLEQSLKKEKALSEQIINSLPAVFFVTNKENKFIRFNKSLINASGYSKEELEQMTPYNFSPDNNITLINQYIKDIKENGQMTIETYLKNKEGVVEPFFFKTMAIDYDGEDCLIGTGINIAERKKAEQEIDLLNKQLRRLSKHLDRIREEERTSIAREIHDELGQQLTVFKINLAWLKSLSKDEETERDNLTTEMLALTESMIHSIRRIAHDLRPPALEDLGLAEALRIYSEEFELRTGIPIHYFTELDMLDLPVETGKALYRIYQESLTNIARYANALQVEASLDLEDDNIILSISDNGIGFNIEDLVNKKTLGIIGMRERAVMIGGKFEILSMPNQGTTILVTLPLYQDIEEEEFNSHSI